MKAKGYSIWLMPQGEIYRYLSEIIFRLSKKYNSPYFEPHVTLLGGMEGSEKDILQKTEKLARIIAPYEIRLTKIGFLDEYFRALFVKADKTRKVMNANRKAQGMFGFNSDYMPHLSLAYGDIKKDVKKEMIDFLRYINFSKISFDIKSLHLYLTEGEAGDWRKIKNFSF